MEGTSPEKRMIAETAALSLFAGGLLLCIITGKSVLYALFAGAIAFTLYARALGYGFREIASMQASGVRAVLNILFTMASLGVMTALWRISGALPYVVLCALKLIVPGFFLPSVFLICCAVSYITGTAFGTASTAGAICVMIGRAAGVPMSPLAGAILAGSFFGDRFSPMSSSALLVAGVTRTDLFKNLRKMFRTGLVPFLISLALFALTGRDLAGPADASGTEAVFASAFRLVPVTALPALTALILGLLKVEVKRIIWASSLISLPVCLLVQREAPAWILKCCVTGYHPEDEALSALLSGGGLLSMASVIAIVLLSSTYSGIFEATGLLETPERLIRAAAGRVTEEGAAILTAAIASMIACNQAFAVILANDLLKRTVPDGESRAIRLEDSVIVIAALVPWNIACAVPLSMLGADSSACRYAYYLWLLPLWLLLRGVLRAFRARSSS